MMTSLPDDRQHMTHIDATTPYPHWSPGQCNRCNTTDYSRVQHYMPTFSLEAKCENVNHLNENRHEIRDGILPRLLPLCTPSEEWSQTTLASIKRSLVPRDRRCHGDGIMVAIDHHGIEWTREAVMAATQVGLAGGGAADRVLPRQKFGFS